MTNELSTVPSLRDRWVAVFQGDPRHLERLEPRFHVRLPSGRVAVDADRDLDALCARLSSEGRTSLEIVFASA